MIKEYKKRKKVKRTKDMVASAIIGGVVTGAAVSLLTPKSGKELRGDIKEVVEEGKEKTCRALEKCQKTLESKLDKAEEKLEEAKEKVKEKKDKKKA